MAGPVREQPHRVLGRKTLVTGDGPAARRGGPVRGHPRVALHISLMRFSGDTSEADRSRACRRDRRRPYSVRTDLASRAFARCRKRARVHDGLQIQLERQ